MLNFLRRVRRKVLKSLGRRECNICGWRGWEFDSDSWHPFTICPNCHSEVRHRLMAACFQTLPEWSSQTLFSGKRVLHFAPEPAVRLMIEPWVSSYRTADALDATTDLQLDMCRMDSLPNGSFETVVACDVLEHVSNDLQAMRELWRVLSANGTVVLTVPQGNGLTDKIELPADASREDRLRLAGQVDHQRIYGEDFADLLRQSGFAVKSIDRSYFPANAVVKNCLQPPVLSTHPLATNYRKIFFGKKLS